MNILYFLSIRFPYVILLFEKNLVNDVLCGLLRFLTNGVYDFISRIKFSLNNIYHIVYLLLCMKDEEYSIITTVFYQ